MSKRGYVYLFFNPATGLTKIGCSVQPHIRKKVLEAEHGPLEVLAVAQADDAYVFEQSLHRIVEKERVEGEWFKLDKSLSAVRDAIKSSRLEWSEAIRIADSQKSKAANNMWQLRAFLDQEGITPFELTKHVEKISYPGVYRYVNGKNKGFSFDALNDILNALCKITGRHVNVDDVIKIDPRHKTSAHTQARGK